MNMIKFIMKIDRQRDGWMDLQMKRQLVLAVGVWMSDNGTIAYWQWYDMKLRII